MFLVLIVTIITTIAATNERISRYFTISLRYFNDPNFKIFKSVSKSY